MEYTLFFRRKTSWKTTLLCKLIILFILLLVVILFRGFWLQSIYVHLVPEPNIKVADAILVEGWAGDEEVQFAADLFKRGFGKYILQVTRLEGLRNVIGVIIMRKLLKSR